MVMVRASAVAALPWRAAARTAEGRSEAAVPPEAGRRAAKPPLDPIEPDSAGMRGRDLRGRAAAEGKLIASVIEPIESQEIVGPGKLRPSGNFYVGVLLPSELAPKP